MSIANVTANKTRPGWCFFNEKRATVLNVFNRPRLRGLLQIFAHRLQQQIMQYQRFARNAVSHVVKLVT